MYPHKPVEYFRVDCLLPGENSIIRRSLREWVDRAFMPVIEKLSES